MAYSISSVIGRTLTQIGQSRMPLINRQFVEGASIRTMSEAGSGEGKGGGSGGKIRSGGGSFGKKGAAQEEQYFRDQDNQQIKELEESVDALRKGKIEYHEKHLKRHLEQIKKHEELMKKDRDANHSMYIQNHTDAADAHIDYLKKLKERK